MGSVNFSIHPLFFFFGIYYSFTGKFFSFIIYTLCAVVHELVHSFVANNKGYKLDKIVLMPFGAVVKGNLQRVNNKNMIEIALAGPLVNLAVGLVFIALWWIFPEIYPFTEQIVSVNISLATINLIPAYPLDGGRILFSFLCYFLAEKKSQVICKVFGIIFSLSLLGLFVFSCFNNINISILFFSLFIFLGTFEKKSQSQYIFLTFSLTEKDYERGLEVKIIALSYNSLVKTLLKNINYKAINQVEVYRNGEIIKIFYQKDIEKIINSGKFYSKLYEFIT